VSFHFLLWEERGYQWIRMISRQISLRWSVAGCSCSFRNWLSYFSLCQNCALGQYLFHSTMEMERLSVMSLCQCKKDWKVCRYISYWTTAWLVNIFSLWGAAAIPNRCETLWRVLSKGCDLWLVGCRKGMNVMSPTDYLNKKGWC
jgi:hypothetical protein